MAKLTQQGIKKTLVKMHGNISAAARALGVSRYAIQKRINEDEELKKVVTDARESMVDDAESALAKAILDGEAWAVCFTLKTQGRGRGYVEKTEHEHTGKDGGPIETKVTVMDARKKILSFANEFREAALQKLAEERAQNNGHNHGSSQASQENSEEASAENPQADEGADPAQERNETDG